MTILLVILMFIFLFAGFIQISAPLLSVKESKRANIFFLIAAILLGLVWISFLYK